MAIKIENDKICLGSFTLCQTSSGIDFDGETTAGTIARRGGPLAPEFLGREFFTVQGGYAAPGNPGPAENIYFASETLNALGSSPIIGMSVNSGTQSSPTDGYISGGCNNADLNKFPFATCGTPWSLSPVTQFTTPNLPRNSNHTGHSSDTAGVIAGGETTPAPGVCTVSCIVCYPFASETTSYPGAQLARSNACYHARAAGFSQGNEFAFIAAGGVGNPSPDRSCEIDRFPFAVDVQSSCVGDLDNSARSEMSGAQSATYGYVFGGANPPEPSSPSICFQIIKFPFAGSSTGVAAVGCLTDGRYCNSAGSSLDAGYNAGGLPCAPGNYSNTVDKVMFASDQFAVDVTELNCARRGTSSNQH